MNIRQFLYLALLGIVSVFSISQANAEKITLLHVSYDATREFHAEYNQWFADQWKKRTGQELEVRESHGASGRQARAVMDGLQADVVSLALAYDVDMIVKRAGWIQSDWEKLFPHKSCPFTSTVVFLVRAGNPKKIHDWSDLVRPDVTVITPNPKTSGGARWNYLAAWASAMRTYRNDEKQAEAWMQKLYQHVPILDTGARTALTTFARRKLGDVCIAWENEAFLALQKFPNEFEIVTPSLSIQTEMPVTLVNEVVDPRGTKDLAHVYIQGFYADEIQNLAARYFYRPTQPNVLKEYQSIFPNLEMVHINAPLFGGWLAAHKKHFSEGGVFDKITEATRK